MIAELGHFALLLALMTSIVQATFPLYGAQREDRNLMALASYTGVASFILVSISFACLASDLSFWFSSTRASFFIFKFVI